MSWFSRHLLVQQICKSTKKIIFTRPQRGEVWFTLLTENSVLVSDTGKKYCFIFKYLF